MTTIRGFVFLTIAALLSPVLFAQQAAPEVQIKTTHLRDSLYLLQGQGGNVVASVGDQGSFIVDDQFAPLSEKINAALVAIKDQPLRFVINTHWHFDHTGGNENFGKAGAVIVAHNNVRERMSTDQFMKTMDRLVPASPSVALPVVTFDSEITLHVNDEVQVIHVAQAHTDGDSLVYFKNANTLHMGDTYFNGLYPFIDTGSGGSVDGLLAALKKALAITNDSSIIVPGHGPVTDRANLQSYHDMLRGFRDTIAAAKARGDSLEKVTAAKPTSDFDAVWGGQFISSEALVKAIYESLD